MFESTPPLSQSQIARFGDPAAYGEAQHDPAHADAAGAGELRAFEWSELTARLNAARDLRHLLRRESGRSIGASASHFADAAARYFRTKEDGKANVNPVTLEQGKCSPGITEEQVGPMKKPSKFRKLLKKNDARED